MILQQPPSDGRDSGSSTVYVLWALGLLGLIASSALAAARSSVSDSRFELATVQAGQAAEAGIRLGTELWQARPELLAGQPLQCSYQGFVLLLEVVPVSGLVDLNAAPRENLERLFIATGASSADARSAADAIIDRREVFREDEYGGQSFLSVAELAYVEGVSPAILSAARPFLTVDSYSARTDLRVSPAGLREALGVTSQPALPDASELRALGSEMLTVTATAAAPGTPATGYRVLVSETASDDDRRRILRFETMSNPARPQPGIAPNCLDLLANPPL